MDTKMEDYIQLLNKNTQQTCQIIDSFKKEMLSYQPKNGWNILEILEHIFITDQVVINILKGPAKTKAEQTENFKPEKLQHILVNRRDHKVEAPNFLTPKNQFKDVNAVTTAISQQRNKLTSDLSTGVLTIDNRTYKHFILGEMTVMDWLHFIIYHTERHLLQIENLKSTTN